MSMMNSELYNALCNAGANKENAQAAAESVGGINADINLLRWMMLITLFIVLVVGWCDRDGPVQDLNQVKNLQGLDKVLQDQVNELQDLVLDLQDLAINRCIDDGNSVFYIENLFNCVRRRR